jgi:hypothetical protein
MLRVVLEGLLTPNASNLQSDVSTGQHPSIKHNCVPPKDYFCSCLMYDRARSVLSIDGDGSLPLVNAYSPWACFLVGRIMFWREKMARVRIDAISLSHRNC